MSVKTRAATLLLRTLGLLPLKSLRSIGALLGRISWWRQDRMAKVSTENLAICFPEKSESQRLALAKQSVIETGKMAAETCAVWTRPYTWLRSHIYTIHGEDLLRQAYSSGKGILVLGPHLGNWEVLGLYLAGIGPITSLYQPPKRREVENLVRHARQQSGATLVPTDRKGLGLLLKALQRGEIVGILPDQTPDSGEFAPFFGRQALTMTLVHKLMQRTSCNAVMAYARRVPDGFDIVFKTVPENLYSKEIGPAVTALNQGVENCVVDVPEQYQWEYKRFKKTAEGDARVYIAG